MKKSIKKTLWAAAMILPVVLAGCKNNNHENDAHPDIPELDPNWSGTITWWGAAQKDPGYGTEQAAPGRYAEFYMAMDTIAAFEEANPKIKVSYVDRGSKNHDYAGIAQAVSSGLPTGDTPNLVSTYGTYVAAWRDVAPTAVFDVTKYGEKLEKSADFIKSFALAEKAQYSGSYYSLPYSKSAEALMLNHEAMVARAGDEAIAAPAYALESPAETKVPYAVPNTFVELMELARKMKQDFPIAFEHQKNQNGETIAVPVIYEDAANLLITAFESAGVTLIDPNAEIAQAIKFKTAEAKAVATQLKKWRNEGLLATKNQLLVEASGYTAYPSTLFGQGKCFAIIASTTGAPWMAGDEYSVDWEKIPAWDATHSRKVLSQGPSLAVFDKTDKNEVAASLKFYDFLANPSNSAKLAAATNYFPLWNSSYQDDSVKTMLEASEAGVTKDSEYATKQACYGGDVLNLNKAYGASNEYFMSPVFSLSDKVRTAAGNIVTELFDDVDSTTDEQISALVDQVFEKNFQAILA